MARLARKGWEVGVIFMTNGVGAREAAGAEQAGARSAAAAAALAALGARLLKNHDFPDNAMDSVPLLTLVKAIEETARDFRPSLVFTHHANDLNIDHRLVHQAVLTAFRPLPGSSVQAILCFEVASSTGWGSAALPGFHPTLSIDISETFEAKLAALSCYDIEMRPSPHPRSAPMLETQARFRGAQSGLALAEAFEVQRLIIGTGLTLPV
jgi:LmbE family N-acetylglucosaminyl deacetylase